MKLRRAKKFLKYVWAGLLFHSSFLYLLEAWRNCRIGRRSAAILMYHRVVPDSNDGRIVSHPDIVMETVAFREQLAFLARRYTCISLADFVEAVRAKIPLPPRAVVLTFDDGWEDNYRHAWPLLREFALPATFFLTAGLIGTQEMFWQEKAVFLVDRLSATPDVLERCFERSGLDDLKKTPGIPIQSEKRRQGIAALIDRLMAAAPERQKRLLACLVEAFPGPAGEGQRFNSFLSWSQVREMSDQGAAFGSHGWSHLQLDRIPLEKAREEIDRARSMLREQLGEKAGDFFAYPNGDFSTAIVELVGKSGFQAAVTTNSGLNGVHTDLYRLQRINVCQERFLGPRRKFSRALFAAYLADLL